jgi:hypothetical protein
VNQIAIELNWANGKNWVGAAANQCENRTSAQAIRMIRERWFGPGATDCERHFLHCEAEMDAWIELDHAEGGPLRGSVAGTLRGIPRDLTEWRKLAGMSVDGEETNTEEDDDTFFTSNIEGSAEDGNDSVDGGNIVNVLDLRSDINDEEEL